MRIISSYLMEKSLHNLKMKSKKNVYTFAEQNPDSIYLTSIVIGKALDIIKEEYWNKDNKNQSEKVELWYCVFEDRKDDLKRTYQGTSDMMNFFEKYFWYKISLQEILATGSRGF